LLPSTKPANQFSSVRVLLDENIPVDLARQLTPHEVDTVAGLGWQGIKNGELLRRATGLYEALVTMDRNLKHQQPLANQPFGVVLLRAPSNRMRSDLPLL
jgi:hypothetical protein